MRPQKGVAYVVSLWNWFTLVQAQKTSSYLSGLRFDSRYSQMFEIRVQSWYSLSRRRFLLEIFLHFTALMNLFALIIYRKSRTLRDGFEYDILSDIKFLSFCCFWAQKLNTAVLSISYSWETYSKCFFDIFLFLVLPRCLVRDSDLSTNRWSLK